jgi:hypothetical protein
MVAALMVAVAAARLAERLPVRPLAIALVAVILVVPTAAAVQRDTRYLTVQHVLGAQAGTPRFYDSTTGYREVVLRVVRVLPRHSVVGGWQSGALSYFAGDRLTVVNLDGVVNPDVASASGRHHAEYIRARRIAWLADFPYATIGLMFELDRLTPQPKFGRLTKFESVDASPPYAVVRILWSRHS